MAEVCNAPWTVGCVQASYEDNPPPDPQALPVFVILPMVSVCRQFEPEADDMAENVGKPFVSMVKAESVEVANVDGDAVAR